MREAPGQQHAQRRFARWREWMCQGRHRAYGRPVGMKRSPRQPPFFPGCPQLSSGHILWWNFRDFRLAGSARQPRMTILGMAAGSTRPGSQRLCRYCRSTVVWNDIVITHVKSSSGAVGNAPCEVVDKSKQAIGCTTDRKKSINQGTEIAFIVPDESKARTLVRKKRE